MARRSITALRVVPRETGDASCRMLIMAGVAICTTALKPMTTDPLGFVRFVLRWRCSCCWWRVGRLKLDLGEICTLCAKAKSLVQGFAEGGGVVVLLSTHFAAGCCFFRWLHGRGTTEHLEPFLAEVPPALSDPSLCLGVALLHGRPSVSHLIVLLLFPRAPVLMRAPTTVPTFDGVPRSGGTDDGVRPTTGASVKTRPFEEVTADLTGTVHVAQGLLCFWHTRILFRVNRRSHCRAELNQRIALAGGCAAPLVVACVQLIDSYAELRGCRVWKIRLTLRLTIAILFPSATVAESTQTSVSALQVLPRDAVSGQRWMCPPTGVSVGALALQKVTTNSTRTGQIPLFPAPVLSS
mmetsp:Transcript_57632/g.153491  ORF Transcript_57632/g.153491 Transcript_57632/m.153491 type:complete len:353 (+) Transcript_57632:686-1744(+)